MLFDTTSLVNKDKYDCKLQKDVTTQVFFIQERQRHPDCFEVSE
jgi:hypothetical protein